MNPSDFHNTVDRKQATRYFASPEYIVVVIHSHTFRLESNFREDKFRTSRDYRLNKSGREVPLKIYCVKSEKHALSRVWTETILSIGEIYAEYSRYDNEDLLLRVHNPLL